MADIKNCAKFCWKGARPRANKDLTIGATNRLPVGNAMALLPCDRRVASSEFSRFLRRFPTESQCASQLVF
jgi:hypothetical protein